MPAKSTIYLSEYIDKYAAASPTTAATKKGLFKYFLSGNNHILKLLFNNFIVLNIEIKNNVFTRIGTTEVVDSHFHSLYLKIIKLMYVYIQKNEFIDFKNHC